MKAIMMMLLSRLVIGSSAESRNKKDWTTLEKLAGTEMKINTICF
jgi:hypothetical protein